MSGSESMRKLTKILAAKTEAQTTIEKGGMQAAIAVRKQARANFSNGKSMSLFDRAHGEAVPNRRVWTIDTANQKHLSETDTTGFSEKNRQQQEHARERNNQEREKVNRAVEQSGQGEDAIQQQPGPGRRFVNEVERHNYERNNY